VPITANLRKNIMKKSVVAVIAAALGAAGMGVNIAPSGQMVVTNSSGQVISQAEAIKVAKNKRANNQSASLGRLFARGATPAAPNSPNNKELARRAKFINTRNKLNTKRKLKKIQKRARA
jgi:hypothetical protein